jgi:hypothetical protein
VASVDTSKPAKRGQLKTGQRVDAQGEDVVAPSAMPEQAPWLEVPR